MICGGSEEAFGFVEGTEESNEGFKGKRGVIYTLGLRSITTVIGHGWPYGAAIEYGQAFSDIEAAAKALCPGK